MMAQMTGSSLSLSEEFDSEVCAFFVNSGLNCATPLEGNILSRELAMRCESK